MQIKRFRHLFFKCRQFLYNILYPFDRLQGYKGDQVNIPELLNYTRPYLHMFTALTIERMAVLPNRIRPWNQKPEI